MKTALRKLIKKWEDETGSYIPHAPIYKAFIAEAKTFLEEEKFQIVQAVDCALLGMSSSVLKSALKDGEQYYQETFVDNNEDGVY
jgi:hypothetical protein